MKGTDGKELLPYNENQLKLADEGGLKWLLNLLSNKDATVRIKAMSVIGHLAVNDGNPNIAIITAIVYELSVDHDLHCFVFNSFHIKYPTLTAILFQF